MNAREKLLVKFVIFVVCCMYCIGGRGVSYKKEEGEFLLCLIILYCKVLITKITF